MQVAQAKADSVNGECFNFLVEHNGFRPTFTQINVDSDTESSKFKEFEDFIIYDGGGVV